MAVVKLNNDLRELEIKEQQEIEIVLSNLSELAAENLELIDDNLKIMVELDFIFEMCIRDRLYLPYALFYYLLLQYIRTLVIELFCLTMSASLEKQYCKFAD